MASRTRCTATLSLLALFFTSSVALAQWDTYHQGPQRTGYGTESTLQPGTISLVWTFPRTDLAQSTNGDNIVDIADIFDSNAAWHPALFWSLTGAWTTTAGLGAASPPGALNFYGTDNPTTLQYGYETAQAIQLTDTAVPTSLAKWEFPGDSSNNGLQAGSYRIKVWFPSSGGGYRVNSQYARYTIVQPARGISQTYEIDQRVGGQWVTLNEQPIRLGPGDYVELDNLARDADNPAKPWPIADKTETPEVVVCADAVQFVSSVDMEIFSSPALGTAPIGFGTGTSIPAVWVPTIEGPISSMAPGVQDFGAMYCVRSYNGNTTPPINPDDPADLFWSDPQVVGAGTAAWRFPIGGSYDLDSSANPKSPNLRDPLEGPIGRLGRNTGGVLSSPTLFDVPSVGKVVVFGGMDGQVYCLNADTGKLKWKGPGVTISEPKNSDLPAEWRSSPTGGVVAGRYDVFGGSFAYSNVVPVGSTPSTIDYFIQTVDTNPGTQSDPGTETSAPAGHMYAIYAWMPGIQGGDKPRSKDALYTITSYSAATKAETTTVVRIDERAPGDPNPTGMLSDPNTGMWVRLGSQYWNPTRVQLSTETQIDDIATTQRVVVADAIMVVPAEIGPFSYSTPVVGGDPADPCVFIGNTNGRVYGLKMNSNYATGTDRATNLVWTLPQVQTENPASDASKSLASPFGAFVASPTLLDYDANTLVIPSMDGNVYGLTNITTSSTVKWTFSTGDTTSPVPGPGLPPGATGDPFSSSVAVKDRVFYVPSAGGRMYAFEEPSDSSDTVAKAKWVNPDNRDPAAVKVPLAAFRYSTPAIMGDGRVYCGCTDGTVYAWNTSDGSQVTWNGGSGFIQPNFFAPVQSSVALDGNNNMFVGTMGTGNGDDGAIYWVYRSTGMPWSTDVGQTSGYTGLGTVFSSPAVGNLYMYVGTGKGRLAAFSTVAFGGRWVGGGYRGRNDQPFPRAEVPSAATGGQVDVFDAETYEALIKTLDDAALASGGKNLGTITLPTRAKAYGQKAATGNKREVYYEWGENIYLVAWGLPRLSEIEPNTDPNPPTPPAEIGVGTAAKRNAVTFRFVNGSAGGAAGGTIPLKTADLLYEYTDSDGKPHCVALAKREITPNRADVPSPGLGWTISVECRRDVKDSDGTHTRSTTPVTPIPLLTGTPNNWALGSDSYKDSPANTQYVPQPIGINNPIGITDGSQPGQPGNLGFPADGTTPNGGDPTTHFNGNGWASAPDANGNVIWNETFPYLNLGLASHGTNSIIAALGLMDRSATGIRPTVVLTNNGATVTYEQLDSIKCFRLATGDLRWSGGTDAVAASGGVILPWDYPPYFDFGTYKARLQRDYPDISSSNANYQKSPDNSNPAVDATTLTPAVPAAANLNSPITHYNLAHLSADQLNTWVQVPLYQPANLGGYGTTVTGYLDVNNNKSFDSGNFIAARPTTYVEAYRKFRVGVGVPADYHMVIDRPQTIDIVGPDRAPAPHGLGFGVDPTSMKDWYKEFSIQNLGNVNLAKLQVAKAFADNSGTHAVNLYSDNVNPFFPLAGALIQSSFDGWDPKWGTIGNPDVSPDQANMFYTYAKNPTDPTSSLVNYGFTLSKARVGDVNPTTLTIPDQRKCLEWPDRTSLAIQAIAPAWFAKYGNTGIPPSLTVYVPLSQPIGSYHAMVPVFSDMNGDHILDYIASGGKAVVEPYTNPTFRVNVTVKEDRLTGGTTPGSAAQIDANPVDASVPNPTFGDVQPAAWRDPVTGNVHLFWSSNRFSPTLSPNSPWYIANGTLEYVTGGAWDYNWKQQPPATASDPIRWWKLPAPTAADYKLPGFGWPTPSPAGMIAGSERYTAPFAALSESPNSNTGDPNAWLFWQGQVDSLDGSRTTREYRLFYTAATKGVVSGDVGKVYSFARSLSMAKMNPKAFAFTDSGGQEDIWLTWYGGDAGRWSIFGNWNRSSTDQTTHDPLGWSQDLRLQTPACLVSVSDPMPLHRTFATSSGGSVTPDPNYMDVLYAGSSKMDQSSDIIMTRYKWSGTPQNPKVDFLSMPRVYGEELLRDPKLNFYTSEHLSWIRPPIDGAVDPVGARTMSDPAVQTPFIWIVLPDGTTVSGTDGKVTGSATVAGAAIPPVIDSATGTYTYTYPNAATTGLIGQMIVDFSAGIVRFTKALPAKTRVFADYTPQSLRMTRGLEQDTSPYAFVEKTPMSAQTNPGLTPPSPSYSGPAPTDRLWLFWRKPATSGVLASTIYYKTYRVGVRLSVPVKLEANGTPKDGVTLTGAQGPAEVSSDGKSVYFTAIDERYPARPGNPGPITVAYTPNDGSGSANPSFDTVTWIPELPETALPTRQNVNEAQVCAFADPSVQPTKIWIFWSSTRSGESDLYYETISPNFRLMY